MRGTPQNAGIGKLPPQAVELEEAVLGALMLEKDAINSVLDILKPDSFYKEAHSIIYSAIIDLYSKNEPIDILTVTSALRGLGKLEYVGGAFYVTELSSKVSSAANLEYHSRIVVEQAMKRNLIAIGSEVTKMGFEETTDAFELMNFIETEVIKMNSTLVSGKSKYVKEIFNDAVQMIKNASKSADGLTGVPTGIQALDKLTGGWQKTDLILVGARPSMGKSDLAINLAINAAKSGKKVAVYSLEMGSIQNVHRMIAIDREIGRTEIRKGELDQNDWDNLIQFSPKIMNNIVMMDEPTINHLTIRSSARKLHLKDKIGLIIIDYMQLIDSANKTGTTNDKVGEISRSLKLMAKELDVPVIALSQLSRAVETRGGDKRPKLSDLRDSGSIEQDADIVIFPYRPEYYGFTEDEDGNSTAQLMELDVAKHRNGALDTIKTRYKGKFGKIIDWDMVETQPSFSTDVYRTDKFNSNGANDFDLKF